MILYKAFFDWQAFWQLSATLQYLQAATRAEEDVVMTDKTKT